MLEPKTVSAFSVDTKVSMASTERWEPDDKPVYNLTPELRYAAREFFIGQFMTDSQDQLASQQNRRTSAPRWTIRIVPPGYFIRNHYVIVMASLLAVISGAICPREDWAEVTAIALGPATILIIGSRLRWHSVPVFTAVHFPTLFLMFLLKAAQTSSLSYALDRFDFGIIAKIGLVSLFASEVIWVLMRMFRGKPMLETGICTNCYYNLTGNQSGNVRNAERTSSNQRTDSNQIECTVRQCSHSRNGDVVELLLVLAVTVLK